MSRLQRVIKGVVNIDLIASLVVSILILGAIGFSILQPNRPVRNINSGQKNW